MAIKNRTMMINQWLGSSGSRFRGTLVADKSILCHQKLDCPVTRIPIVGLSRPYFDVGKRRCPGKSGNSQVETVTAWCCTCKGHQLETFPKGPCNMPASWMVPENGSTPCILGLQQAIFFAARTSGHGEPQKTTEYRDALRLRIYPQL